MGFIEWLGFKKPPEVENNIRDSGALFYFGRTNSGENVNEQTALQITTVYACVRLLADSIAQLPLHLFKQDKSGRDSKATKHPLYKILYRQPNPEMTSFSFREVLMTQLLLWGNAYAQIIRNGRNEIVGLYPLSPENIEVDRDDDGHIYYIYSPITDEVPSAKRIFRREEIFHIPGLGFNGLVGFSPIAMMKNALGSAIAVERYGSSFFKHSGMPIGVLEYPQKLKDPERVRQTWNDTYGGASNAHKVAVLEEGMHFHPISLPPGDSQFLTTREFDVEEICRIFRVPPHLVQCLSHATFSNIEHQGIDFVVHTLDPWIIRIEQAIIKDLLLEKEQDVYYPKFNVDGQLRGAVESRMRAYATCLSNGIMSPNEVRRKENLPPIPPEEGGDFYLINGSFNQLKNAGAAYGINLDGANMGGLNE